MRGFWAVYKRETAVYFRSFIAYAIGFAVIGVISLFFMLDIVAISQFQGTQQQVNITAVLVMQRALNIMTLSVFFIAPLLTMRLLSEEAREGTLEILMTLPMGDWAFVVAKFLAAFTYYTFLLLMTLIYVALLASIGSEFNWGFLATMYLGTWLYGGSAIAVCLVWSAVTEDQLVAAFLGAATVLTMFLGSFLSTIVSDQIAIPGITDFIREIGTTSHLNATMLQGLLLAEDVLYFVLVAAVALFITTLIVSTRRWRAA